KEKLYTLIIFSSIFSIFFLFIEYLILKTGSVSDLAKYMSLRFSISFLPGVAFLVLAAGVLWKASSTGQARLVQGTAADGVQLVGEVAGPVALLLGLSVIAALGFATLRREATEPELVQIARVGESIFIIGFTMFAAVSVIVGLLPWFRKLHGRQI